MKKCKKDDHKSQNRGNLWKAGGRCGWDEACGRISGVDGKIHFVQLWWYLLLFYMDLCSVLYFIIKILQSQKCEGTKKSKYCKICLCFILYKKVKYLRIISIGNIISKQIILPTRCGIVVGSQQIFLLWKSGRGWGPFPLQTCSNTISLSAQWN